MSTRPAPLRARSAGGGAAALSDPGALPTLDGLPDPVGTASGTAPAGAPAPDRPPLHVVPDSAPRPRRVRRARVLVAAAALAVVAVLFGVAASQAQLVNGQVRLDQLERDVAASQSRYQDLRLEVARLEAPERIVAEAQHRLGMIVPSGITYLSPAGVLDGPVPAAGAATPSEDEEGEASGGEAGAAGSSARTWSSIKPHLGTATR